MEKIILFGGFGFIGKNLCEYLQNSYNITIIDRIIDHSFLKKNSKIKNYIYDFSNQEVLNRLMKMENPDYIINLISIVTANRDLTLFNNMIKSNLDILLKIYESSKNLSNLKLNIQFGSGEEYGNINPPFTEGDKEIPSSPYAIVKLMTTNTAIMLNKNYNYPICIVRPSNLFGNYQNEEKFIPYIIKQLKNNLPVRTSPGEQKRDFIEVKYFSKEIEILLKNYKNSKGTIFNLGSGESLSLKEIIVFLREQLNSSSEVEFGVFPYRENEMMDFRLNIEKLKKLDKSFKLKGIKDQLLEYIKGDNQ